MANNNFKVRNGIDIGPVTGATNTTIDGATGDVSTIGQFTSTQANDATTGQAQIYLNGATGNRIDFNTNGQGGPTTTTRSVGTKVVLYPSLSASLVDYAIGANANTIWNSVDSNLNTKSFQWYGGTTEIANLNGVGDLQIDGDLTVTGTNIKTGVTDTIIQIDRTSATTNNFTRAAVLRSTSTGTPAVGFGTGLGFNSQTSVTNAGSFVVSDQYTITFVGSTDFTLIGAASNTVGVTFTASGAGSGTGKASNFEDVGYIAVQATDIGAGTEDFSMKFGLMQNGAAYADRMILDSAGNLDIAGDLEVSGANIGTGVNNVAITIDRTTTTIDDTAPRALTLRSTTSLTPAVGFGTALEFEGQTSASNFENAGFISVNATDIGAGTEDFSMNFGLMTAGAPYATKLTLDSLGNLTTVGDLTVSGGNVSLNNGTSNIIDFNAFGQGPPTTTTRSAGTKVVLFPSVDATFVDYAIGATSNEIWNSVKSYDAGQTFKWYGGTTEIASLGGTGNLQIDGNLDVQGGTVTDSTGALSITTGASNGDITLTPNGSGTVIVSSDLAVNGATSADITTTTTTASVFNTTATTVNAFGAATTTNIGAKTGSSIINGTNRFTSPVIYQLAGATNHRGLMISNGNAGSVAAARNAILMRTFPVSGGARGGVFFENARGTETTPTAIQTNDLIGESSVTGYATNNWVANLVSATPGAAFFIATENWADNGAGTVTNAGTGYQIACYPTATNVAAANAGRITVLSANPQTSASRSDAFTWSQGKTGSTQNMALDVNGNLTVTGDLTVTGNDIKSSGGTTAITLSGANVIGAGNISTTVGSISASGAFDSNEALSTTANLLDTNTAAGSSMGITTKYWTSSAKTTLSVPQSGNKLGNFRFNSNSDSAGTFVLGAQINAEATENWTSSANGSRIIFFANRQGESWTTGHTNVISAAPESASISSNTITLESSAGTDYAVLDANKALFSKTVRTTITSASVAKGGTFTPAVTAMNSIILEITAGSGTTTIDVSNLTVAGENAVFDIMVYNNSGGSINSNAFVIINNGNTALDHGASIANGTRAIFEVNCVDIYANAQYAGDAV